MKNILFLLSIALFVFGCSNKDIIWEDYDYQTVYFPYQSPVRTIMLGDEVVGDNSIDLAHAFSMGVATGGVFANEQDIYVMIDLAPDLADNLLSLSGDTLELLPPSYYEATIDQIIIPAGSFNGKFRVDLKDAFFADPNSTKLHYVIPVIITDATTDTILSGKTAVGVGTPDRRVIDHWEIAPKDYTLFAVKYINPYHGAYLLRGRTINTTAVPQDTVTYTTRFITDNRVCNLVTRSLSESVMNIVGGGNNSALLKFNADKSIVVSQATTSSVVINGTGKYFTKDDENSEKYNEKKHRTIYLDYIYEDGGDTFHAMDSLVFLDTNMTFEEFKFIVDN